METLFVLPKPDLVMNIQDTATSDDPLEIYLHRKGWPLTRVKQLQASISEKKTIDMFKQQSRPLSAGELELQADIQEYLDSQ